MGLSFLNNCPRGLLGPKLVSLWIIRHGSSTVNCYIQSHDFLYCGIIGQVVSTTREWKKWAKDALPQLSQANQFYT